MTQNLQRSESHPRCVIFVTVIIVTQNPQDVGTIMFYIDEKKQEKFIAFKKQIYNQIYTKVYEYQEIAKKNPNKFYILLSKPTINMYSDSKYENGEWVEDEIKLNDVNSNNSLTPGQ